ncbi:MAG: hypothetical protein ACE5E8_06945 [Acidimicrobiia bacterium]
MAAYLKRWPADRPAVGWLHMGFNPFRSQSTSTLDVVIMAGAILAAAAVLLWALAG